MTDATPYGELRVNYDGETLEISDMAPEPLTQFQRWFADRSEEHTSELQSH